MGRVKVEVLIHLNVDEFDLGYRTISQEEAPYHILNLVGELEQAIKDDILNDLTKAGT